jgi:proteasome lid subunit RPN8/RPN11
MTMGWIERTPETQPHPIAALIRTMSAIDAFVLLSRLRASPVILFKRECRAGIIEHLCSCETEIGGLLLGRAYAHGPGLPSDLAPAIAIEDFLPSNQFRSTAVSLAMDTEIWDRARAHIGGDHRMIVGWYHSHPNLGAFFSATDRRTQRAFFNQPYHVGLVIDPVRGQYAWFCGAESQSLRDGTVVLV